jgi:hypothetical protein
MTFWHGFAHVLYLVDMVALVAFVLGMVVAPLVILMHRVTHWKIRLRWTAVALCTSWLGLWMYWRRHGRPAATDPASSTVR